MYSFGSLAFLCIGVILFANAAPPTQNRLTNVNLRIEGRDKTIFEGIVATKGHNVTTASGGNHHCDGTNLGANVYPGPTATSALDDAARKNGFAWDGCVVIHLLLRIPYRLKCNRTFFEQFDDFFITSIGDSPQTSTEFWGILLNYQFTPVGGCQQQVTSTDEILWAFDAFNAAAFLKLTGPKVVKKGKSFVVTVINGLTGEAVAGVSVGGATTDLLGKATVVLNKSGNLKAEKTGTVRSNELKVKVLKY